MSDLAQFANKTLSNTSSVSDVLSHEMGKSGYDYAVERMSGFFSVGVWPKGALSKDQISQELDEYDTALQQARL